MNEAQKQAAHVHVDPSSHTPAAPAPADAAVKSLRAKIKASMLEATDQGVDGAQARELVFGDDDEKVKGRYPGDPLAQVADPDKAERRVERVNPAYSAGPPGTLDDLAGLRASLASLKTSRAEAEVRLAEAERQGTEFKGQLPTIEQARQAAAAAAAKTAQHRADTAKKSEAQRAQQERQKQAQAKLDEFAGNSASLWVFKLFLAGMTAVPGKVGSDSAALAAKLGQLQKTGTQGKADVAAAGAKLDGERAQVDQVAAATPAVQATAQKSVQGAEQMRTQATTAIATTNQEAASSSAFLEQLDAEIAQTEDQTVELQMRLAAWARAHRGERTAAIGATTERLTASGFKVTRVQTRSGQPMGDFPTPAPGAPRPA